MGTGWGQDRANLRMVKVGSSVVVMMVVVVVKGPHGGITRVLAMCVRTRARVGSNCRADFNPSKEVEKEEGRRRDARGKKRAAR